MRTAIDTRDRPAGDVPEPDAPSAPVPTAASHAQHGRPGSEAEAAPSPGAEQGTGRTPAIRLLIVDDHPVVRQGLESLFATVPGVEVVGLAADGRHAVDLAITLAPDVVLMDIGMPGIDGIEATRRMISARHDLAVIVLTGYTDPQRLDRARQAGAQRCLFKHGGYEEVIDAVLTAAREGH